MKPTSLPRIIAFILAYFTCSFSFAQNISVTASAVWMTDFSKDTVFNVTGALGSAGNIFAGNNFGVHTPNAHTLIFRGGQLTTHSTSGVSDVCGARMYYRVYPQGGTPGTFNQIDFFFGEDCEFPPQFNSGGSCALGDQKFDLYIPDGATDPYAPTDLTLLPIGNYIIEVYYEIDGLTDCAQTVTLNNGGSNYKASFSIQNLTISSTNPTTCNGTDGSITISGVIPDATYSVSYTDDGNAVGPNNITANTSGQIIISGLNPGIYSDFKLVYGGNTTNLTNTITLTNPVIVPKFKKIDPFCAGSTAPILPTTSQNGVTGTWNPAVIDNQTSNSYQFTPDPGQCASNVTIDVVVNQNITPTFSFGTALTLCAGATPPSLYKPSDNGVTGTWSPVTIDNQNSATYTFTPNPNQCATATNFVVTVNPKVTPTFSFGSALTICAGGSVPTLPTTSSDSITGSWSPSVVDNQNSGSYTFTPTAGQCATTTNFVVTVNPNVTPTFSFGSTLTICAGGSVPTLPTTSSNGITGTWSPSVVDNQSSGSYVFTPTAGLCASSLTFTVTVTPNITPSFSFGTSLTICVGGSVPSLPNASDNGITGTWNPATVDNQNSGSYRFTPTAGQCATTTNFIVTVNPNVTPTFSFGSTLTICAGGSVPTLPTTSNNGITGTWSPATVDNQNSGSYTFTPANGQCAVPVTFNLTVNPVVIPVFSFGTSLSICAGASVPSLPTTSSNGVTGTWAPSTVDNQNSNTYIFTPTGGQCINSTSFAVTVTPGLTPVFTFGTSLNICKGAATPALPSTSTNGVTGTWSPSVVDNQNSGTYSFTPDAGQCAVPTNFVVTVNPVVTPIFSFGTSMTICAGTSVPSLPATSSNGINGTWNPSSIDNQNTAIYTFTPSAGQCGTAVSLSVTVDPSTVPTFSLGSTLTICAGSNVPTLPTTSDNGISGTWSPSVIDNQNSSTYIFTPTAGQCVTTYSFAVTVNPIVTPTFSFGTTMNICAGSTVISLPTTSSNGVTGTWSPSTIDNQNSSTYTFTPNAGQCAVGASLNVTVNANVTPTFSFGTTLTICAGATVPSLPTTSTNGVAGTWSPSVVDNQNSGTYSFTPDAGQCAVPTNFVVTVNPVVTPIFSFGTSMTICAGTSVPSLPNTSTNGITGSWNPATINNQASAVYAFTPNAGQCASANTFTITVAPPTADNSNDVTVTDGSIVPTHTFTGSPGGVNFSWTNSNTAIGLGASGTGNIPSFTATNLSGDPIKGTITVTPAYSGCTGTAKSYVITVLPLDKNIFVANVFTPNGDGKNDVFYARSNYITTMEMKIFNQNGQQLELITDPKKGWDGKCKGTPQPVGVYMYTLKATMTDGRTITQKGNVTLLR